MTSVQAVRTAAVHELVLEGVSKLIAAGGDVTFARVATAAGVPERTVYRHFPNRDALMAGLFDHVNRRIGFEGESPMTPAAMTTMVRRVFPGFDTVAPVVAELLASPEGRRARLLNLEQRQGAAMAVVSSARPDLDTETSRHIAAVVQVLGSAAVWQALRDFWQMDGDEAADAVTTVIDALLNTPTNQKTGGI